MERLNHHHLYIFWTLARRGTFSKAAEALHIAQSAVTAQIKSLEGSLGFSLVDRSNKRKPTLTEEGRKVLDYAESIFATSQDLMNWAKGGEPAKVQTLRVGALSGLSRNLQFEFLGPAVGNSGVRIEVTTGDQDRLVRLLAEHSLDIILSSHNVPSNSRVPFHSHVLTSSQVVFVTRSERRLRRRPLEQWLRERRLFIPGKNFEARPELDAILDRINKVNLAGEIDDIALLRIFAVRSGAIVAIPKMGVKGELAAGELVCVGTTNVKQKFYGITRQKKFPNRLIQELISLMRPRD